MKLFFLILAAARAAAAQKAYVAFGVAPGTGRPAVSFLAPLTGRPLRPPTNVTLPTSPLPRGIAQDGGGVLDDDDADGGDVVWYIGSPRSSVAVDAAATTFYTPLQYRRASAPSAFLGPQLVAIDYATGAAKALVDLRRFFGFARER